MIVGAVVVPHPPILLPGVGRAGAEPADLRARCVDRINEVAARGPAKWVVVGGSGPGTEAPSPPARRPPSARPAGAALDARWVDLSERYAPRVGRPSGPPSGHRSGLLQEPLSLAVGRHLLEAAGHAEPASAVEVPFDAAPTECARRGGELAAGPVPTALLVCGDGSARRTPRSPGRFDERAAGFDAVALAALRSGRPADLLRLDAALAAELMVAGRAAWQVLAGAFATDPVDAEADLIDPWGVAYLVGRWLS